MILIGTDGGIYRWFEGAGWPTFHGLQDREVVGLSSPGLGVLAAVDRAGEVFESTDHGLTWRTLPLPLGAGRPSAVAFDGAPPALIVAVKPLNLYRRAVGAPVPRARASAPSSGRIPPRLVQTWQGLAEGATALLAPGRSRVEPDAEAVRMAGWGTVSAPPAPWASVAPEVRALVTAPGAWLASVTGAGLWRSGDSGRTWEQCPGLPSEVYAVRPVPGRAGHVWAATHDGCRLSTDFGATWEDRSTGLENARLARAIEVKPGAPDTLLAGASAPEGQTFALYESTNGGKSWAPVTKRAFPEDLESDTIADIRFDPAAPDNVVVALGSGELWVTRNGGAYWGPLARQIRAARVLCAIG
jgi:photosystem II stability/assembly factor-like uncharacterized protein